MEYSEIGTWSEAKLNIVRKYAKAYPTILSKQDKLTHLYIDAFASPGLHRAKLSERFVTDSPLNALQVEPPFAERYFIDVDNERVRALEEAAADHAGVHLYQGDANRLFADPPEWLLRQLGVYREGPARHLFSLCAAVASVVLGDGVCGDEVREEVENALEEDAKC